METLDLREIRWFESLSFLIEIFLAENQQHDPAF